MTRRHHRTGLRGGFAAVLAGFLLSSCSVQPGYDTPRFPFATKFGAGPEASAVYLQDTAWWQRFDDPVLNKLVDTALQGNLDLEVARERVTEARALAATIAPGVSATGSASGTRRGGSDIATATGVSTSLGMTWLLDPYGGRKAQREAAAARIQVADAELDAARLLLLSNLINTYIDLRFAQTALTLRQQELRSRRRTLRLVRDLLQAGAATRLDGVRAEALVSETKTRIPPLEADIRNRMTEIAVLLGQNPGTELGLGQPRTQPHPDMPAEIGIPADLLRNRPDIRIAERLYYAAVADIGAAKADLYPALSLGGTIELSVFDGIEGNSYRFGPTIRLPALPDGPRKAAVSVRESRARQAHTTWSATVLGAIRDVETALTEYYGSALTVQAAQNTVRLYNQTVSLTRELIANDGATIRDLLDAEQSVAAARINLAEARRGLGRDLVALNVSLGAGNRYKTQR